MALGFASGGGMADPMTARGDLIIRNASNATARLAIGAANTILASDGTDVSFQTRATLGLLVDPLTTRGDMLVRDASASVRLALGATNSLLTSNGTDAAYQTVSTILSNVYSPAANTLLSYTSGAWGSNTIASLLQTVFGTTNNTILSYRPSTGWAANTSSQLSLGDLVDPMTTAGDIIIRNSSNAIARLAVGTAAQFLAGGTTPAWGSTLTTPVGSGGTVLTLTTSGSPGANAVVGVDVTIPASSSASTYAIKATCNNTAGRILDASLALTGGTPIYIRYPSAATLASALTGIELDLSGNVTNVAQNVDGILLRQLLTSTGRTNIFRSSGNNGCEFNFGWWQENVTLSTIAATTDTTNTIPADSIVLAVMVRCTTTVAGTDSVALSVGDSSTTGRFASGVGLTAGNTEVGLVHMQGNSILEATGPTVTSATAIRLTLGGGADNIPSAGAYRVVACYINFVAPSS